MELRIRRHILDLINLITQPDYFSTCFLQLHNAGIYSLDALIYTTLLLYRYRPELGDESADREDRSNDERDTHTLCHGSIQCQHYSRDKTATVENKVKGSRRRPSQGLPPGASGRTSQRLASVDPAGSPSEISPVPPHTAEATRSGLSRPPVSRLRPPRRWRIAYAQARPKIAGPLAGH